MPLRPHQQRFSEICQQINDGAKITDVIAFVVPGGGKSTYCPIASQLIHDDYTKILWVCPRESLMKQAEQGFRGDGIVDVGNHDIRLANNSGDDPFRGCSGAVTSYQGIVARPEYWIKISKKYKIILFLDEYDSLIEEGAWSEPIKQIYGNAFFRVCATGTIDRSDELPLLFTPYNDDGSIDFRDTESRKWIIYGKEESIRDGSTVHFTATLISGSGKYVDLDGITRSFKKFTGKGDELITAFRTDFAYQMFLLCLKDWNEYRKDHPWAKIIILANNIDIAEKYNRWFKENGYDFDIATSGDEKLSAETIRRFKMPNGYFGALDGMVGIGKVYKGLDIKPATFLVFLTRIRGKSWVDQAVGRVQRAFKGKTEAFVYAPDDPKMRKVLQEISDCVIRNATADPPEKKGTYTSDEEAGPARTIQALYSKANIDIPQPDLPLITEHHETQSEIEKRLRVEINHTISRIISKEDQGNIKTKQRIIFMRIRQIVNNGRDENGKLIKKSFDEMSIKELKAVKLFVEMF